VEPRCGHVLRSGRYRGEPCHRPLEHPGEHRSIRVIQREIERKRGRYRTDPAYRDRENARHRERKRKLRLAGLCVNCSQPSLSEWYCWDCLNKKEESRALTF
jgi:hypothetical protein